MLTAREENVGTETGKPDHVPKQYPQQHFDVQKQRHALLIGEGITVLGTLRCLAHAGVDVQCLSARPGIEKHSRYYRAALRPDEPQLASTKCENLETILQYFLKSHGPSSNGAQPYVLIATSDHALHAVANLSPELSAHFFSPQLPRHLLTQFTDKDSFRRLLAAVGTPHPHSIELGGKEDLDLISDDVLLRCFIKPRDSQSFYSAFRVKAFRYSTRKEAVRQMERVEAVGLKVLLQEYVQGPPSNHIYVEGVVDDRGTIHGLFARRRLRMHPSDFGNSTAMRSIPLEEVSQAVSDMKQLLAKVPFRGIFSAEWKLDSKDGIYKLLEVNCRPWWYVGFLEQCGVNIPSLLMEKLKHPAVPNDSLASSYKIGVTAVYPYYDFHAFRRERGLLGGLLGALRSWIGARYVVFSMDDVYPALRGAFVGIRRFLASRIPERQLSVPNKTPLPKGQSELSENK